MLARIERLRSRAESGLGCERPIWVDAVDKVGDVLRIGNNRIQVPCSLNQRCAASSYRESILLNRASKIVYRQHRSFGDISGPLLDVRKEPGSGD